MTVLQLGFIYVIIYFFFLFEILPSIYDLLRKVLITSHPLGILLGVVNIVIN